MTDHLQADLFGAGAPPPPPEPPPRERQLFDAWLEFHRANPAVYIELKRTALRLVRAGRERYGINGLFEVLRWHRALETTDADFKINCHHAPFYSRLLMNREDELAGFFKLKHLPEHDRYMRQLPGWRLKTWACEKCGSDRWVGWRAGPAHEGFARRAQCVPCGHVQDLPADE